MVHHEILVNNRGKLCNEDRLALLEQRIVRFDLVQIESQLDVARFNRENVVIRKRNVYRR